MYEMFQGFIGTRGMAVSIGGTHKARGPQCKDSPGSPGREALGGRPVRLFCVWCVMLRVEQIPPCLAESSGTLAHPKAPFMAFD